MKSLTLFLEQVTLPRSERSNLMGGKSICSKMKSQLKEFLSLPRMLLMEKFLNFTNLKMFPRKMIMNLSKKINLLSGNVQNCNRRLSTLNENINIMLQAKLDNQKPQEALLEEVSNMLPEPSESYDGFRKSNYDERQLEGTLASDESSESPILSSRLRCDQNSTTHQSSGTIDEWCGYGWIEAFSTIWDYGNDAYMKIAPSSCWVSCINCPGGLYKRSQSDHISTPTTKRSVHIVE